MISSQPYVGSDPYLSRLRVTYAERCAELNAERDSTRRAESLADLLRYEGSRDDTLSRRISRVKNMSVSELAASFVKVDGVIVIRDRGFIITLPQGCCTGPNNLLRQLSKYVSSPPLHCDLLCEYNIHRRKDPSRSELSTLHPDTPSLLRRAKRPPREGSGEIHLDRSGSLAWGVGSTCVLSDYRSRSHGWGGECRHWTRGRSGRRRWYPARVIGRV